jgi:outer membrane cobalamin receptor
VLDLAAAYRWTEHLAPRLRVENALDEDYEEVAGFPAPERAWILGLALDY